MVFQDRRQCGWRRFFHFERIDTTTARVGPGEGSDPAVRQDYTGHGGKYAAASPTQSIPVEKGKALPDDTPGNNVYTRAAKALEDWIRVGVIVRDAKPSLYAYFQEYNRAGNE